VQRGCSAVGIHEAGLLGDGHAARVAADDGAPWRFLLLAARPPPEPVVQYEPFVMNTREEIEGAPAGCQSGQLTN